MTMAPSYALQGSTAESGALSTGHPSATGTKPNGEDYGQKTPIQAKKKPRVVAKVVSTGSREL